MEKDGREQEAGFGARKWGTIENPYISGPDRVQVGYLGERERARDADSSGSKRFHELLQEIGELHDRKQRDYGTPGDPFANVRASERWGIPAWLGALIRLNDKVVRLQSYAKTGQVHNESAEDSLRDIAVYALISLVLLENTPRSLEGIHGKITWDVNEGL